MNGKSFVTLFQKYENINFQKDVGMIPYTMSRCFSYNAKIVCIEKEDIMEQSIPIVFIKKKFNSETLNVIRYLWMHSKEIDVLNLYHIRDYTILYGIIYKLKNRDGKLYIKGDMGNKAIEYFDEKLALRKRIMRKLICDFMISACDVLTVESSKAYDQITEKCPCNVILAPNGYYNVNGIGDKVYDGQKENVILTVGRIGAPVKAHDILLKAYAKIAEEFDFVLKLVGPIDNNFKKFLSVFFDSYPHLKKQIIFTGSIENKEKLKIEYEKAKIFIMTSLEEGAPLVISDAINGGGYLLLTDTIPMAYDLCKDGQYGLICKVNDIDHTAEMLKQACIKAKTNDIPFDEIKKIAKSKYNWSKLCEKVENELWK